VREREKKTKQPQQGRPQREEEESDREQNTRCSGNTTTQKKDGERMKERQRQRQSKRKEEVLFRCTDTKHIFGSSLFLFFFIALSLSRGAFCVLRFFHKCFAASCLLFAVCDRTTNKKQPTGCGARTPTL